MIGFTVESHHWIFVLSDMGMAGYWLIPGVAGGVAEYRIRRSRQISRRQLRVSCPNFRKIHAFNHPAGTIRFWSDFQIRDVSATSSPPPAALLRACSSQVGAGG